LSALQHAQEVMGVLRDTSKMLVSELECFAEEVAQGFLLAGHHLERILELLDVLLDECFKVAPATIEIPPTIASLLEDVSRRLNAEISRCKERNEQHLMRECEQDLHSFSKSVALPSASTQTLSQLIARLALWHQKLRSEVAQHPSTLKLEALCPRLLQLRKTHICIPVSPLEDREQPGQHVVQLDRVEADVRLVRLRRGVGSFQCRLLLRGNDGRDYPFFVEPLQSAPQRMEAERFLQLQRVINQQFEGNKDARARHLILPTPAVVYVTPTVRLFQDIASPEQCASLANICHAHLEARGMDPLAPQLHHRKRLAAASEDSQEREAAQAYQEVCKEMLPANVIKSWLVESVPGHQALWYLRQRFAHQLALHSVLNYAMNGEDQTPENVWLSRVDGTIVQPTLRSSYEESTLVHSKMVPFRLTRNLSDVMQPFGIEGPFTSAMCVVASCLSQPSQQLHNFVGLFFREDLQIHQMRLRRRAAQGRGKPGGEAPMTQEAIKDKVIANAETVMSRLRGMVPDASQDNSAASKTPCTSQVEKLIESAQNPASLSHMHASWQAWL
jgi:transformation/transcription domain-associated protein